jgi:hypothetical protein
METREAEEIITNLRVQVIRAKLELCRIVAAALMQKPETQESTLGEGRADFEGWLKIAHDGNILESALQPHRWRVL